MKFIKNTTWQEAFEGWRLREANNPRWIECATTVKGWPDWESWRSFIAQQFGAMSRDWKMYQFENPLEEISSMLMGPYSGWQSRVESKNKTTFNELLEIPSEYNEWSTHSGILSIMNGLPFPTEFIGLIRKDTNKIICLDGHHRATAIALAKRHGKQIDFSQTSITIVLTELGDHDCYLIDEVLKRGTSKYPQSE